MDDANTVGELARDALAAYEDLLGLAEEIEDEWTYVNDLAGAWQARIGQLIDEQGAAPATTLEATAIGRALDEIGRISDPHRAIDWLSTFPQVVLLTLGPRS